MAELIKVNAPVCKPLFEGVQGENESRSIQFDITPWMEELGDGAVTATAKRPQDSQPYPVTVTKVGNIVTWKPTSTDTAYEGVGSFQLEYTVDSVLAKTCIWSTMVAPSLDPAGDPPDPYDNWLAEMRQIAADATQAATDAEAAAETVTGVNNITVFTLMDIPVERGGYYSNGSLDDTQSTVGARARTATAIRMNAGDFFINDSDLGYGVIYLDDDMSTITDSGWLLTTGTKWVAPYDGYARITIRKQTSAWITDDELDAYRAKLHVYKKLYDHIGTTADVVGDLEKEVKANQNGFTYFDPDTLIWGGLENGERQTYYKWRAITKDIQQYNRDVTVKADDGFRFGVATYIDDTPSHALWSGWVTSYTIKAGTRFRIQFAKATESNSICICNAEAVMAAHFQMSTEFGALLMKPNTYQYTGEKIPSTVHGFDSEKVLTMSYSNPLTSQDIEIYGDYLFVAFSGQNLIRVYSMTSKALVASLDVDPQHGSGMQFSAEKYADGDPFPLLYVGGWSTNIINVVRITNTEDTWAATIVRQLYIPTSNGGFFAPSIDAKNNVLYCFGTKSLSANVHTGMVLLKCDLDELTDNGNGTYTPRILTKTEVADFGTQQGRKYYGGNIYVGFSNTGSPHNSRLVAIDATTGDVKTDIDMTGVTTSENEGVCYQIVGDKIYWYYSDYYNIYKLTF